MKKVLIYITLKEGVLDPQGKTVQHSLNTLGYETVREVRVGKYMELLMEDDASIESQVEEMCEKLLANPVIENYTYTIEEVVTL
ncbi:phosphoribosylformylglycinamidine synthase subunit PurS [Paraliobacillus sp. PM-2]|uniref:phosphoribosylformylglycinamidine synthase subunit PurS n=1 Tax=Paraliobacillus sp. PM-2 TaxID=1462524 RepID=UPI00061CC390|nr:phosphoribosylformylglycinamidine synthase subunit PurS [Paraliobacillus sp. PM-2]CQR47355.1 phosphoribosylformylglycinamidine synthase subunit PurS [Paraliobacillus sp. PM-2]